ncbi:MAG: LLM class flavin-dependent oxidoreductase [Deltaproteobacteria bacterium]
MKIGLTIPTMVAGCGREATSAWARGADQGPYSMLAVGERTTYDNIEQITTLAACAALTERVELLPNAVVLPMHNEVMVAKQLATIDVLSGGRLAVALAVGGREEDFRAVGAQMEGRRRRLEKQLELMRALWDGQAPFEGAHPIGPKPLRAGGPPILIAAMNPGMTRAAARFADGISGWSFAPDPSEVERSMQGFEAAWQAEGRSGRPRLVTGFWYALGPDAEEQLFDYAKRYLGVFGAKAAAAMAGACTATGTERVRQAIIDCAAAGADEIILVPTSDSADELARTTELVASVEHTRPDGL